MLEGWATYLGRIVGLLGIPLIVRGQYSSVAEMICPELLYVYWSSTL